ncbi:MAG: putative lipid II flippase FtsW [Acidobacteria bacterium]|nr:putative lipid II flippase FtsW [Acidobacteriota bacterium]
MARTLKSDKLLFLATLLLVSVSVVMVYSASAVQAAARYQAASWFLYKQLAWAVLGITVMLVVMRRDYHEYRRPALIWSLVALAAGLLVLVFFFNPRNGTYRWITLAGVATLQPSELAKLVIVLFTAAVLDRRMHRVNDPAFALLPIGAVTFGLTALVLAEPDFGTSAVIVGIVVVMLFTAGLAYRYLIWTAVVLVPAAAVFVLESSYRRRRLMTFLDPWQDPLGDGFQIIHSLYAVGSGGLLGRGLMAGIEKLYYIPEPHTDFIYAVIAEELGLVGTTLTLACFVLIAWRGLRASLLAPDRFGSLLALGLTSMIALQAFVNISVVTKLLPTKGIPLPFVSNGGSSLLINLVAMGILLNISQQGSPGAVPAAARRVSDWTLEGQGA